MARTYGHRDSRSVSWKSPHARKSCKRKDLSGVHIVRKQNKELIINTNNIEDLEEIDSKFYGSAKGMNRRSQT